MKKKKVVKIRGENEVTAIKLTPKQIEIAHWLIGFRRFFRVILPLYF